jgi:hypothetical protein
MPNLPVQENMMTTRKMFKTTEEKRKVQVIFKKHYKGYTDKGFSKGEMIEMQLRDALYLFNKGYIDFNG